MFKNMLDFIKDDEISRFTSGLLVNCKETFLKPASSSGKYHPEISNVRGGLLNHTMLVVLAAERLVEFFSATDRLGNPHNKDLIYSACILHDAWKYTDISGNQCNYTTSEHGLVGYNEILKYTEIDIDQDAKQTIAEAVRYHMSAWCHDFKTNERKEETETAKASKSLINVIVQMADMLASSKKFCEYKGEKI